ncbi:MAG: hypothetical protein IK080_11945 [Clostridia bacterium]|nr:hypothetical protein [Clostridia bacterium]
MDPKELKAAAAQLTLTEEEKQAMIAACAGRKRKPPYRRIAAIAAALLVLTALAAAPGLLSRAGRVGKAADAAVQNEAVVAYDDKADTAYGNDAQSESAASAASPAEATKMTDGNGGGVIRPQKYRARYYTLYAPFVQLVGREASREWMETIDYSPDASSMVMLQFVRHFNITREQFDKANLETARIIRDKLDGRPCMRPMDYTNQEDDEIYNADIIYTFDEDIINAYYLGPDYPYLFDFEFDEAVAAGTYTSQTEVWVDVDEMEAEILAKYGSLE